jgi:glutamate N-acetyltransferase / amino-acid N-acetyltransferase
MSQPTAISPLAPKSFPLIPAIDGVRFATAKAGIKYKDRTDVMFVLLDEGTQAAGVFTRSLCASAPVDWCRKQLPGGKARALIVNSGNANAFTGKIGEEQVALTAKIVSEATGFPIEQIFLDRRAPGRIKICCSDR